MNVVLVKMFLNARGENLFARTQPTRQGDVAISIISR